MTRFSMMVVALALAPAASAQQAAEWDRPMLVRVELSSFHFSPKSIGLVADRPATLLIANRSRDGHNFTAPEFFAAAEMSPADGAAIRDGSVELGGRQSRAIALVPKAGRYKVECTHTLHKFLGMRGEIVVR